jgi:hypothetical protein
LSVSYTAIPSAVHCGAPRAFIRWA